MKAKNKEMIYFSKKTVILIKEMMLGEYLKITYRKTDKDFTRIRKLTFEKMIVLLLQKGIPEFNPQVQLF